MQLKLYMADVLFVFEDFVESASLVDSVSVTHDGFHDCSMQHALVM